MLFDPFGYYYIIPRLAKNGAIATKITLIN